MNKNTERNNGEPNFKVSRRDMLTAGGAILVGAALSGWPAGFSARGQSPSRTQDGVMKPVVLPKNGSIDPVDFSLAENAFWNEQMMEHAKFFVMLMPGPELANERSEAERFQQNFAGQLEKSRTARLDQSNYAAFNRSTIELLKPFADWKRKNGDLQASGKLKSLTWSTFFVHTALEAEWFSRRLEQFSRGDVATDLKATALFWTQIMGEHADFIAHLLDPAERDLILKAMQTGDSFHKMHDNLPASKNPVEKAVDEIIDFKTSAEMGIQTGKIKSIIHPTLADHVRREALKAADDLKRSA
jgi:hypothetical protein